VAVSTPARTVAASTTSDSAAWTIAAPRNVGGSGIFGYLLSESTPQAL